MVLAAHSEFRIKTIFVVAIAVLSAALVQYSIDLDSFAQQSAPSLVLSDFQFEDPSTGEPDYFLELGEADNLKITGLLRNESNTTVSGFNLLFSLRSEDPEKVLDVFPKGFLCLSVGAGSCTNITLAPNQTLEVTGQLIVDTASPAGRYFVNVAIDPSGVTLSPTSVDEVEILLVVGADQPEYHPVSLTFSPPSPIAVDSEIEIIVRTSVENTGRPATSSEVLIVSFAYCLLSATSLCEDDDYQTTGFPENGSISLTQESLQNLRIGRVLNVSIALDPVEAGLEAGIYAIRVSVSTITQNEADLTNNELSTFLRIQGGVSAGICTIEGDITMLGEARGEIDRGGQGESETAQILFLSAVQEDGDVVLHALDLQDIENPPDGFIPGSECPAFVDARQLNDSVSSFEFDRRAGLLFVGLESGELTVINFGTITVDQNDVPILAESRVDVANDEILSMESQSISADESRLFIGTRDSELRRIDFERATGTQSFGVESNQLCEDKNVSLIRNVQEFGGFIYFTAGTQVFRFLRSTCSFATNNDPFFSSNGSMINAFQIARVNIGSNETPSLRTHFAVGLENGQLHVVDIREDLVFDVIEYETAITHLAINSDSVAQNANAEAVFVGTRGGQIDRVNLESGTRCADVYETTDQASITTLNGYEPDPESLGIRVTSTFTTGLVFASTSDSQIVILDQNCSEFVPAETASGTVTSNILSQDVAGLNAFGIDIIEGVIFTYAVGSDLIRKTVP